MLLTMEDLPIMIAYAFMGILAILPIYFGSFSALPHPHQPQETEVLSTEDAYWFPIMGSIVLFSLYLVFTFISKDLVNQLILIYFSIIGTFTVFQLFHPLVRSCLHRLFNYQPKEFVSEVTDTNPSDTQNKPSKNATPSKPSNKKKIDTPSSTPDVPKELSYLETFFEPYEYKIFYNQKLIIHGWLDTIHMIVMVASIGFMCYYNWTKHWIASNIIGEAFCFTALQWMQLDTFSTGIILLSGLFFYDIFWVFGTDVMVTVATSFDAPIKLLFPRDIFAETYSFALLGLGDIVIPGIFVALCLRYDYQRALQRNQIQPGETRFYSPYFRNCLIAYILGLTTTIGVMHTFKAAQPALLYLSPACIISVIWTCLFNDNCDFSSLFAFTSESKNNPNPEEETTKSD